MDRNELTRRYQQHAAAMSDSMREAGKAIDMYSKEDLEPTSLIGAIDEVLQMLGTAHYHAHRMRVYSTLLGYEVPVERTADRN